jgi:membrane protein
LSTEPTTRDLEKRSDHLRAGHGRWARHPWQMPWPAWKDTLWRTALSLQGDRVGLVAAGVTFYLLLSIVPAIAAIVSLYSLLFDVSDVAEQLQAMRGLVPSGVRDMLHAELTRLADSEDLGGLSLAIGILVALWGASRAHQAIAEGLDVAYGERSKRGIISTRLRALALATITALAGFIALGLLVLGPALTAAAGWKSAEFLGFLRWPFLAAVFWLWLMVTYRFSPSHRHPKWRWVSVGSLAATLLWLAASALLSWYASDLADLGKTYGSLAGTALLLLWLYSFCYCLLLGAELDSEIEHQTTIDTTVGPDRPQGSRGAHVADTVGRAKRHSDSWFQPPGDEPPPNPD